MGITYRPAVRSGEKLMLGIAGASGSGKTFSALEIATGIQEVDGGEIFVIDTENRRAAMYAGKFKFMHGEMRAPFTPEAYLEGIEEAVKAGAKIIVIDSMSHEHEGEGGILEIHEAALTKMAGNDYGKREKLKFTAWIEPKRRHHKFLNRLLQVNAHIIFCFRAKDKLKMVKVQKGDRTVNEPVSAGWQPIAADRLEYEMSALFVLPPGAKGKPDLTAEATKLPEPLIPMVQGDRQISRELGRAMAKWARGDEPAQKGNRARQEPNTRGDGPDGETSPGPRTTAGGTALHRYHRELSGARDSDELSARHDGSEDFATFSKGEKETAREFYKLHLRRIRGMSEQAFAAEVELLLEGVPA